MPAAYDEALLALVCWREARGEGREGMRAVAHVVANRVKAWGKSWLDTITSHNQFSSMSVLGDSQTILWPAEKDLYDIWEFLDAVYTGKDPDNTSGALYYANEAHVTSEWYRTYIMSPSHPITVVIGHQTFRK